MKIRITGLKHPNHEQFHKDVTFGRVYEVIERPTRKVFIDDAGDDNYGAYSPQGIYTFEECVEDEQHAIESEEVAA